MRQLLRRGVLVLGMVLALTPISAFADEQGNSDAIAATRAQQAWIYNLTPLEQGVAAGQREIANARAIAQLLSWSPSAQGNVPNSMQQYAMFCDAAIQHVQAQVANATAMATARPWDAHAQMELANANAMLSGLWDIIGTTYPGNPYIGAAYADDQSMLAEADSAVADDQADFASDDSAIALDDDAVSEDLADPSD